MYFVDVDRGRRDGIAMAKELEHATQEPAPTHGISDDEYFEDDPEALIRQREVDIAHGEEH
jgi:hypothetical protein